MAGRTNADRAKQFMPFDALKGFREALWEKERIIVDKVELSDEKRDEINQKLHYINVGDIITVVCYNYGDYEKVTGIVSKFNETDRSLTIVNKTMSFDDIYDIEGDFFYME